MEAPQPKRSGFALFYARSRGEIASEKWGVRLCESGGVSLDSCAEETPFPTKNRLSRGGEEAGNNCRPKLNLLSGSDFDSGERRGKEERREGAIILGLGGWMFNVVTPERHSVKERNC